VPKDRAVLVSDWVSRLRALPSASQSLTREAGYQNHLAPGSGYRNKCMVLVKHLKVTATGAG